MAYNFDKDISTDKWDIKIDTAAKYGYYERNSNGAGGGLWFGTDDDAPGQVALIDYDGMACLPRSVAIALRGAGYYLDSSFDPDPV